MFLHGLRDLPQQELGIFGPQTPRLRDKKQKHTGYTPEKDSNEILTQVIGLTRRGQTGRIRRAVVAPEDGLQSILRRMHILKTNTLARLHNGDNPPHALGFKLLILVREYTH